MGETEAETRWLVLVYQFPQGPGSRRVKIWRRLQSLGAVAIKNSVYVLPMNEQSQEDFQWLLTELTASGAEGAILESRFVDGMSDAQVEALFNSARNADYEQLVEEVGAALPPDEARRALARARRRIAEIEAIDFFGAEGHAAAEATLRALDERISEAGGATEPGGQTMQNAVLEDLKNRVWVTRRNVRVDRIASVWLIRRWIDPEAQFKFVPSKGYAPAEGEIRFDMFEAEFTHEGEDCTFEVLLRLLGDDDRALRSVAEIVHDIDLKDGKFGRPETEGIANLLAGIVAGTGDDPERLTRGGALFEDLYRFFREVKA